MFIITNKAGVFLCYQAAKTEKQAIEFARMYGHRGAFCAKPV